MSATAIRSTLSPAGQVFLDQLLAEGWVPLEDAPAGQAGWFLHLEVVDTVARTATPERWAAVLGAQCLEWGPAGDAKVPGWFVFLAPQGAH